MALSRYHISTHFKSWKTARILFFNTSYDKSKFSVTLEQFRYFPVEMYFYEYMVIDYHAQNNGLSFLLGIAFGDMKAFTVIENLN